VCQIGVIGQKARHLKLKVSPNLREIVFTDPQPFCLQCRRLSNMPKQLAMSTSKNTNDTRQISSVVVNLSFVLIDGLLLLDMVGTLYHNVFVAEKTQ
jgi:hypothetical protein